MTMLLPAAVNPVIGKYTSRHGPRWWNVGAFVLCGLLLLSFGELSGDTPPTQVLFVANAVLLGVCFAVVINANQVAISVAARRFELLSAQLKDNGQKPGRILSLVTPGNMLGGLTAAWSAGMLLGPAYTSAVDYTHEAGWALLCRGLGGLSIAAGIGSWFVWKKW